MWFEDLRFFSDVREKLGQAGKDVAVYYISTLAIHKAAAEHGTK
jgi:predicted metalloprotease